MNMNPLEAAYMWALSPLVRLVDSIANLIGRAEWEDETGD